MLQEFKRGAAYWLKVCGHAFTGWFAFGRKQMYGFIVGIAILALQVRFGVVSKTGVTGSWWAFLGPYLGSIILAYMFHVSRSAWQLHEAQATSIEDLKRRVEAMNRTWPWPPVFTIETAEPEFSPSPVQQGHVHKMVCIVLKNSTGKQVDVWTPVWKSEYVESSSPFNSCLRNASVYRFAFRPFARLDHGFDTGADGPRRARTP